MAAFSLAPPFFPLMVSPYNPSSFTPYNPPLFGEKRQKTLSLPTNERLTFSR
nr:MAG TPA: hypothetical protein [Caudoviricetes sp.]